MNERIDELIFQVGYTKLSYTDDNFLDGRYALTQEQLNKFAELIVRETLKVTGATPSMAETAKKHFGVEE